MILDFCTVLYSETSCILKQGSAANLMPQYSTVQWQIWCPKKVQDSKSRALLQYCTVNNLVA